MNFGPPDPSVPGISQARIRVSGHLLLQGIFLTQGSKLLLLLFLPWQGDFFFTTEPPGKPCVSSAPSSTWALSAEYRAMTALLSKASGGPYSVQVYDLRYNWENHLKSTKLKIRCGKLKGSKQRNEGYKNLRVSWAPHHQQAPEQVAPVTQGPLQRISAEAGENTLRRAGSQSVRSRRPNDSIWTHPYGSRTSRSNASTGVTQPP